MVFIRCYGCMIIDRQWALICVDVSFFFLECGASPLAPCYDGRGSVGEAILLSPTRELAVQSAKVSWMCTVGRCGCKPKRLIKILDVVATILGDCWTCLFHDTARYLILWIQEEFEAASSAGHVISLRRTLT